MPSPYHEWLTQRTHIFQRRTELTSLAAEFLLPDLEAFAEQHSDIDPLTGVRVFTLYSGTASVESDGHVNTVLSGARIDPFEGARLELNFPIDNPVMIVSGVKGLTRNDFAEIRVTPNGVTLHHEAGDHDGIHFVQILLNYEREILGLS